MTEMILGFALGAMVFTETGREIGNKVASATMTQIKKIQEEKHDKQD